jgi:hypothetical protein
MPPITRILHGQSSGGVGGISAGTPLLSRDFITDQTWRRMAGILGSTLWTFTAGEGFGSAAAVASSFWYFPGDLPNQKQTWEWKYNSHTATGAWGGLTRLNYHSATDPSGGAITTVGYYFLRMRNNDSFRLSRVTDAGITDLGTAAVTTLFEGEIYRQYLTTRYDTSSGVQSLLAEYAGRARSSNTPGAAAYNLTAIADPCVLRVEADGVNRDVTFASGDPLIAAFNAVTNAEVAAVVNAQIGTYVRAWVPAASTYVALSSLRFGSSGSVRIVAAAPLDDANTALAFPLIGPGNVGEYLPLSAADNTFVVGFNGARGGYVATTSTYLRFYSLEGI